MSLLLSQTKTVDYRNARYQGITNRSGRRNGIGILLDDGMNVYLSQWSEDKLNGMTFIYLSSGNYIYGYWKNNQPHGVVVFRNQEYILLTQANAGKITNNAIAITNSLNHLMVFNGESIAHKGKTNQFCFKIFESLIEIADFQDNIMHVAQKNDLKLDKSMSSFLNFLTSIYKKHEAHLSFDVKDGIHNFGFKNGLGFRFFLHGNVYQRLTMHSIGSYGLERGIQYGIKYHQHRCFQQGNFTLKQTITYNKMIDRPRQKCNNIYEKIHKKSLHYRNQFYDPKNAIFFLLQSFIRQKLSKKCQEHMSKEYQLRKSEKTSQKTHEFDTIKEDYVKKLIQLKDSYRQSKSKLITEKHHNNSTNSKPSLIERTNTAINHKRSTSKDGNYNKYINQYIHLTKKESVNHNKSYGFLNKSPDKQPNDKSFTRSPNKSTSHNQDNSSSAQKIEDRSAKKEIKYLKDYKMSHKTKEQEVSPIKSDKQTPPLKSKKVSTKIDDRKLKNEVKIRQQLFMKQALRAQRATNNMKHFDPHPHIASMDSQIINKPLTMAAEYRQDSMSSFIKYPLSQAKPYLPNSHIQRLQQKRERILHEFKNLNTISMHDIPPSLHEQIQKNKLISSRKKIIQLDEQNRYGLEDFNKKYRHLLADAEREDQRHTRSFRQDIAEESFSGNKNDSLIHKKYHYYFDENI